MTIAKDLKYQYTNLRGNIAQNAADPVEDTDLATKAYVDASGVTALDIYPVGSIYISIADTDPGTLFGGTWEAFGAGKTLVGLNSAETEFDTVEETGGEKTHTLTTTEIPSHAHNLASTGDGGTGHATVNNSTLRDFGVHVTNVAGGGLAHNNLQPYIVVYFFKRTA